MAIASILSLNYRFLYGPVPTPHDAERLEAAERKRRRRAEKYTEAAQRGGLRGTQVAAVAIPDELAES